MRKTPAPVLHWPKLFEGWIHGDNQGSGYGYRGGNGYGDGYHSYEGSDLGIGSGNGEGTGPWYGGRRGH